jgi:hypothetical protein
MKKKTILLTTIFSVLGLVAIIAVQAHGRAQDSSSEATTIAGIVLDDKTGAPIPGAQLTIAPGLINTSVATIPVVETTIAPGSVIATADADGNFSVQLDDWAAVPKESVPAGLRPGMVPDTGRVTITAAAPGYGLWTTKNQDVYRGTAVHLEVRLSSTAVSIDDSCVPQAIAAIKPECQSSIAPSPSASPTTTEAGFGSAASCSGYSSNSAPPPTIRIRYVTGDDNIWVRDFRTYVKEVLPREWSAGWNMESLQAGAMAVRDFGWYYVNTGPAGWKNGQCYDITSSTLYQLWGPGGTNSRTDEAVDSVWFAGRLTRAIPGAVFPAYYKAGFSSDACGQEYYPTPWPGNDMSQWGSQACALDGQMWNGILRRYYFYTSSGPCVGPPNICQPTHVHILDDSPGATDYYTTSDGSHLNVYALARDGSVYEKYYRATTGSWSGWQWLQGTCTSGVGTLSSSSTQLWIFCRGADTLGFIWGRRFDGSSWQPWTNLGAGGGFQSGPAVTEYYQSGDAYHLNVYALGWDGNIYEDWYHTVNNTWSGWHSISSPAGGCTSAPGTDWRNSSELYVFCRGTNGAIWYTKWNGSVWAAWTSLGGSWISSPGATDYYQSGDTWHLNVYGNGELGDIWENYRNTTAWSGWHSLQGVCQSGAGASNLPGTSYLYVFCRWDPETSYGVWDGGIYYRRWTGSAWGSWTSLGRP